jgi:peptidoglycan/LPS O-acetylase OafA/YrhL
MSENKLKHIIQIDGLRCFAVLGVLISHFIIYYLSNESLKTLPFGSGVNLFYVISGYLITTILLNKKQEIEDKTTTLKMEIKNFFAKRVLRIFPLYYIVILFILVFNYDEVQSYFLYLVTYTTNIYMTFSNTYIGNNTHLWSLAVEEQFYLIWPFVIFLINKKYLLRTILFLILSSLFSKYYFFNCTAYQIGTNAFLTSCFDSLGMGALLAYLQLYNVTLFEKLLNKKTVLFLIISYIILFLYPSILSDSLKPVLNNFSTSLIYFFIVGIAAQNKFNGITKYALENKVSLYLGKISYGIYIIHNFMPEMFYDFFARKLPPTDLHSIKVIYWISLTIIIASISWFMIERPILKLKKYYL